MAKLYFRFGPMNSGKSTRLLQDAYNYEERGQRVAIMKPTVDTKDEKILSRLGVSRDVDIPLNVKDNTLDTFHRYINEVHARDVRESRPSTRAVDCLFVDEAQFLSTEQINGLFDIVVNMDIPVIAYGIRTDFKTESFPGSKRLLEIAHSLDEMKTICRCGKKALFNARKVDGKFIANGNQVAIDDGTVEYESMCGHCYREHVAPFPLETA